MIFASFVFYHPVIFFAKQVLLLGMFIIPKTCAYLLVDWAVYMNLWHPRSTKTNHSGLRVTSDSAA